MERGSAKILTYNTCYGLKANTVLDAYNATWRVVHTRKDPEEIAAKSDFSEVYEMVQEEDPNIVVLNEIFDDLQTGPVSEELKRLGFENILVGHSGHHTKPLLVSTVVATRLSCEEIVLDSHFTFPEGVPGTGGGAVGAYFEDLDLFLMGFHIAYTQGTLLSQLEEVDAFYEGIRGRYRNIIFTGDFNRDYAFYQKHSSALRDFDYAKGDSRTFPSFFPIYKPFRFLSPDLVMGQVDNVFYRGNMEVVDTKVIHGKRSDHRPIVAEFKI